MSEKNAGIALLTEETQEMLASIHVTECLASMLAVAGLDLFVDIVELGALEAVQQYPAEGFVEVLFDTGDDFLENVGIGGARSSVVTLCFIVFVEKLDHGGW